MANLYYATDTNRTLTPGSLPMLSEGLESFRAYQWEVEIDLPDGMNDAKPLTLAAKSVSQIAFTSEDIIVERVNDKFFYPGKVTPEAVTITFDNLVDGQLAETLYDWMSNTYDAVHGVFTPRMISGVGHFKSFIRIYQLNNLMFPVKHIQLYGAYPKAWKLAEFNYSTNEFHSVEVEVRFDFAVQYSGLD